MEQKDSFLKQISEIDSSFAAKLNEELENSVPNNVNYENLNGEAVLED